jgi:hypothetical protein
VSKAAGRAIDAPSPLNPSTPQTVIVLTQTQFKKLPKFNFDVYWFSRSKLESPDFSLKVEDILCEQTGY